MSEDNRYLKWAFVGYPGDSLPEDYDRILDSYFVPWVESPIHSSDSEFCKPHIHFMVDFGKSKKSYKQVCSLIEPLGIRHAIGVERPRNMIRYFAHLDNPEKEQFSIFDLKFHGGAELSDFYSFTRKEIDSLLCKIFEFCRLNYIYEYCVLVDYININGLDDWRQVLNSRSLIIINYLKSARHGGYQDVTKMKFDHNGEMINE